jgi:hypothetical protein
MVRVRKEHLKKHREGLLKSITLAKSRWQIVLELFDYTMIE